MLLCRDDALMRLLNAQGYQPVRSPRTNLVPPELYVFTNDKLVRCGPLADYMQGAKLPSLRTGALLDIQQTLTSSKSWKAAASFLTDALRCIGVDGAPKVDLSFVQNRALSFSFTGVTYAALDPSQIGQLLTSLHTGAIPQENIDDGDLHIVYEYAYADTLLMQDTTSGAAAAGFQALKIDNFIDVGGKAKIAATSNTTLSFKPNSGKPAAFACKIGRLEQRGSQWAFFPEEVMGAGLAPNEGAPRPYLIQRGAILDVQDSRA
jgi:hypothetical protein